MKVLKIFILFMIVSPAHMISAQNISVEKIKIEFTYDESIEVERFSKKSDTLNYYLFLGSEFLNDAFLVTQNDTGIFHDFVQTDPILGASELIKLKNKDNGVKIMLNSMPLIELPIIKGKYYILIDFSRPSKTLLVKYSKLLPKLN